MDAFQPIVHSICETSTLYCDPATACMVAFNSIMLFIMGIVLRNILNTLENEYCRQIHFFHLQIEQYTDINQNFFENTFPIPPTDSEMIPTQRLTLTSETEKFEEYLSQTIQKHSNEAKDPNLKSLRVKPKKKVDVKEDLCVLIQYSLLLAGILRNSSTETESLFDYSKLLEPITDDQLLNKLIMIFTSALSFYLSDMSSMILRVKECGDPLLFIHHLVTIVLLVLAFNTRTAKIGAFVYLTHTFTTPLLQLATVLRSLGFMTSSLCVFIIFALSFLYLRVWTCTQMMLAAYQ